MTRWARSGNTQKHKKMPEDPTPWEEFVSQRQTLAKTEKKFSSNKIKKISNDAAQTSLKKRLKERLKKIRLQEKQHDSSLLIENDYNDTSLTTKSGYTQDGLDSEICSKKNKKKKKVVEFLSKGGGGMEGPLKSKKLKTREKELTSVSSDGENMDTDQTSLLELHKTKKHKNGKKKFTDLLLLDAGCDNEEERALLSDSENEEGNKISNSDSCNKVAESTESNPCQPKPRAVQQKNKPFFEKVKEARARNGILLLPKDVENRLYRMKKSLRAKGFSGEQIKKMVRDARRKAELKFRKTLKTCFNCREFGHVLANCPKVAGDNEQGTGICFKCGSTEHVSFRCHIKTADFPYAKCFVCHNTGHLSRNCPENKHGVYPKGGKCNLCGSIYHLRKDCPKTSKKKNSEEIEVTAHTINDLRSVDDDVEDMESKPVKQKKPKVVKF